MRIAPSITLTKNERDRLMRISRSRRQPLRLVQRAKIVLLAADGCQNLAIAKRVDVSLPLVGRWRMRYAKAGFAGIEKDAPRPGRTPKLSAAVVAEIVHKTTQETPANRTHWSQHTMAKAIGTSASSVARVWHAHGLKPHRITTFKLSNDPQFSEKLEDIVALYINPPEHAVVLCADEKSQIQAFDRTQPGLPLKRGRGATMTHDYKRHGTTTLFAALSALDGTVIGSCMQRHRHQEWLKFLRLIDATVPAHLTLHLIADNYATHKHPVVKRWLKRHPRLVMHFTPTSASWLNMVERFFRDLTANRIRRGIFRSVPELVVALHAYIAQHNSEPKPFIWTASASDILEKVVRGRQALLKTRSA